MELVTEYVEGFLRLDGAGVPPTDERLRGFGRDAFAGAGGEPAGDRAVKDMLRMLKEVDAIQRFGRLGEVDTAAWNSVARAPDWNREDWGWSKLEFSALALISGVFQVL